MSAAQQASGHRLKAGPGSPLPDANHGHLRDDDVVIMLTKAEVQAVKGFDPAYASLWQDVQTAADRVHLSRGTDRSWAWHHLLLAVGNFKAQMPLFPEPLPPAPGGENLERGETLEVPVPDGHLTLQVEDPATWRQLSEHIRGLAVPRTTTVLSALWPGRHLIADWRSLSAAAALVGARNGWAHAPVEPERTDQARVDWENYSWYRRTALECASQEGLHLIQVERVLYTLGDAMPEATWTAYASQIEERLARMSS
jgi:hypothetical protein